MSTSNPQPASSADSQSQPNGGAATASGSSATQPAPTQSRQAAEEARKDRTLAEFMLMLDEYEPLTKIPNEVTDYYLQRVGFDCQDVRLKRLISLAAQKFVSDIAADAYQHARIRTNATGGRARVNQPLTGPGSLKLKPSPPPQSPFSWDISSPSPVSEAPSPPTSWLSARDMKLFGARPLSSTSDIGLVRCNDCGKPILRSFVTEHADNCAAIRAGGKKGAKGKPFDDPKKDPKKRKASPSPDEPAKKKVKPAPKVTKGRLKGPVDLDRHCGVINDKGVPCSRSLTCKSHSMGAKRGVLGRSRNYDELLLDWQRAHNPNFVEPVKRETKAEKKEKREKEKLEKKRLAGENAAAVGLDPASVSKKPSAGSNSKKMGKKAAAAAAAQQRLADEMREDVSEDLDDLDSEVEMEELIKSVRTAKENGVIGVPLAVPCDAGTCHTHIRLYLDIVVGSTKPDVEHDRSHVSELASKVRDLNQKLEDIRREQQYQREREEDYRNLSEATNARAVWYSIAQITVLLATCAWQLRHLKRFFEDRKTR
ncbi:hypothetical protein CVT26_000120 [Gymnopilus dilepis]|uniref:SCA7 domain-containing protein n=1 Tax=Gymnopilus dilepis TaxID=231916 RepID=A0A409VGW7_9AGAR|nr:hypothetical protein CVT26_000120 [Gymnopilus dilepis]